MLKNSELPCKGDFISGKWNLLSGTDEQWQIHSPADLKDKIISVQGVYKNIDNACIAAKGAYLKWARLPLDERKEYLFKLKKVFLAKAEQMAELISREVGKPLWEAKTESAALSSKIDITLEHSLKLVAEEKVSAALPGVDGFIRYKPRGVMAVVGPFNFPAHLPNGHIIPALITGNTIVFKPSDKTPAVGQFYTECFQEAGFPDGVFNLIQGQGEVGRRLVQHELVDGVLFTGSYEVGLKIKQDTLDHYWKLLALEMGGKNSSVIWKDADLEKAVYETVVGAFMTSGQRCSCTSKVILHKAVRDEFIEKFHAIAKKIKIGHWSANPFMGPLISQSSVDKYIRFQEIAKREGAESLMRGKVLNLNYEGYYVTPSINLVSKFSKESSYQKNEIFGPNVAIYTVSDFDEALEIVNDAGFGLVMALFSKDRALYEKAILEARVGLLNWNRTTNGASSRIPFGGINKSGNDRPSGHFAVQYCTIPVGSLEDFGAFDKSKILPGIPIE
ncbi:MAG: succinylglutamate-semialdehyde dehydrogenase [Bdellovibrionales bacterium]